MITGMFCKGVKGTFETEKGTFINNGLCDYDSYQIAYYATFGKVTGIFIISVYYDSSWKWSFSEN